MLNKVAIETRLRQAFQPTQLDVTDHSAAHASHREAKESGGGHFSVTIVSAAFSGKSRLQRHQLINNLFSKELKANELHALSISAYAPGEQS